MASLFGRFLQPARFTCRLVQNKATVSACSRRTVTTTPAPEVKDRKDCPIRVYTEWDPLEEIIVGRPENLFCPPISFEAAALMSEDVKALFRRYENKPYPEELTKLVKAEVDELCNILKHEGVNVVRPDVIDNDIEHVTPDFVSKGLWGCYPRDVVIAYGNEIIEAPMAARMRYFEYRSFRRLCKEYFKAGADWAAAPKPFMSDELFDTEYPLDNWDKRLELAKNGKFCITEFEPVFDAATAMKAGKDLFIQRSNCTNDFGIEWLRRHLEPKGFRVHTLTFPDPTTIHMDEYMIFVRPGLIIHHPNPIKQPLEKEFFTKHGWDLVEAPQPIAPAEPFPYRMWEGTHWLYINVVMLDPNRVLCEASQTSIHKLFEKLGVEVVKVPFAHAGMCAGGIHCWTTDVRRKGDPESYFG